MIVAAARASFLSWLRRPPRVVHVAGMTYVPTEHVCGSCDHRCVELAPLGRRVECEHRH